MSEERTGPSASRRHDPATTRAWLVEGTRRLVAAAEAVDDDPVGDHAAAAPSLLPGWSRAHVLAHVARNAEALTRLATWARTGQETPMYASPEQRDADIETSARQPAAALRRDVAATAADLERALDALGAPDEAGWDARVRVRQGAEVSARVVPWLRVREVWLHAVDLDVGPGLDPGAGLAGAPAALLDELVADLTSTLGRAEGCPAVELRPTDDPTDHPTVRVLGPRRDVTGADGSPGDEVQVVRGSAADLVRWLSGRSDGDGLTSPGPLPALPAWL